MNREAGAEEDVLSPWRERKDGTIVCRNCGCVQGTGHHPTCIEAGEPAKPDAEASVQLEPCFLIFFEDQDRRPEIFTLGGNAEAAARHRFELVLSRGWNAHLFQRIDDGKRPMP